MRDVKDGENLYLSPLIDGWRTCAGSKSPPYYFPGDQEILEEARECFARDHDSYICLPEFYERTLDSIHTGLIPQPYFGDLRKARVFVLMLNPGLSGGEYYLENCSAELRSALLDNLGQHDLDKKEYPFVILDPKFAWHPAYEYWERKFRDLASDLNGGTYSKKLATVAKKVAVLECFAYHARSPRPFQQLKTPLLSTHRVKEFVRNVLVQRAARRECLVVVARATKEWPINGGSNVIVFEAGERRAASLSAKEGRRKRILQYLRD